MPYEFFDGEVTASAADPWGISPFYEVALVQNGQQEDGRVELVGDPLSVETGCANGPAPADANALAARIQAEPDFEATAPVAVSVGGTEGLAMDVTVAPAASDCEMRGSLNVEQGSRMRLYLVDLPEGSTIRILAIAVVAPEARFEDLIEAAAPVIDSVEFHAP